MLLTGSPHSYPWAADSPPGLDQLGVIIEHAREELLARRDLSGHWRGGCRSRLLESALGLHLFRRIGIASGAGARLEQYCRDRLAEPPTSRPGAELDDIISRFCARAALGDSCSAADASRVTVALSNYQHASGGRKVQLWGAVLGHLAPELPWDAPPTLPSALSAPAGGGWLRPTLTAARLLRTNPAHGASQTDIDLLCATQSPDGSWDQYICGSIVVLLALHHHGVAPDTLRRGVNYLLSQVRDDGGLPFISNEDIWLTSITALTLAEVGTEQRELAATAEYLCKAQLPNGGWGFAPGVSHPDADDTTIAVTFLDRIPYANARQAAHAGTRYLLDLQNADGGFNTYHRGAPSEVEITAKAVLALLGPSSGPVERAAALNAWHWLEAQQRSDGSYHCEWNLSAAFPIAQVMRAARALEAAGLARTGGVVTRCLSFLRASAVSDAGWGTHAHAQDIQPLSTAYAVSALASAGDCRDGLLEGGVGTLLATPSWSTVTPDSAGPRPFVYDVPMLYAVYRLGALNDARVHLRDHSHHAPIRREI